MKIKLKLYAILSDYLPPGADQHEVELEIAANATPYEVIDQIKVPREMAHLVLLNGVYLYPEERDKPAFKEGDALAIWPPVAGG